MIRTQVTYVDKKPLISLPVPFFTPRQAVLYLVSNVFSTSQQSVCIIYEDSSMSLLDFEQVLAGINIRAVKQKFAN